MRREACAILVRVGHDHLALFEYSDIQHQMTPRLLSILMSSDTIHAPRWSQHEQQGPMYLNT